MKSFITGTLIFLAMGLNAQTQIIAHRGVWQAEGSAQNSIKSLKLAQKEGVYGSEFDVRMTKDLFLVVNHDPDINGVVIDSTDYKELRKQKLKNGEKLPSLREYLIQGKKNPSVKLILEIKEIPDAFKEILTIEKTLEEIKEFDFGDQIQYISFSLYACKLIKEKMPNAVVLYLKGDLSPAQVKAAGLDGLDYHYSVFQKHPNWLKESKELHLITNVWTVDDRQIYEWLKSEDVDFITTNRAAEFK